MIIRNKFIILVLFFIAYSCRLVPSVSLSERTKSELFTVEKEFCSMAQKEGIQKAFVYFAADSAVILRGELLVKGKESILRFYEKSSIKGGKLVWSADFADVSASGDLGYTYGKYTYTSTDSFSHSDVSTGIFHTVWKRQKNGQWRFVWD